MPLFSPQGHVLCRPCFQLGSQAAADQRAQPAFGGGMLYLGNDGAMQAGMRTDLEGKMLRKCAKCKAHAVSVVHVTFHYVNGITRGRTYENKCASCAATFKTESPLRMMTELAGGLVCTAVGAGTILFASGWSWLIVLCLPLGLWATTITIGRAIARLRNPLVPRLPGG
jgi:hypothetical protein